MHEEKHPERPAEARATARTNLFMAATLQTNDDTCPVTIRDLSPLGAQVESSLRLEIGAEVTLSRGHMGIQAHVTWAKNRRCGLRFDSPISVQDWMASPVSHQQQRVDRVVAVVKSGALPPKMPVEPPATTPEHAAQDLQRVSRLLEMLGDELASDPTVVAKHGIHLQNLDIALQTLTAIAGAIRSKGPADAANIARLDELRVSCAEALQRYA